MSIGLVIENISGAFRASTPASAGPAAAPAANGDSGTPAPAPNPAPNTEPASGQAQLTPGFSVLVVEMFNEKGDVIATIPSAQQLAAYRNGTAIPPG